MNSFESTSAKERSELVAQIAVSGVGAVSPAGWGMDPLRQMLRENKRLGNQDLERPGWSESLPVRRVPAPEKRPSFLSHARLRRTSPITQYAIAAALEALGRDSTNPEAGGLGPERPARERALLNTV